jgi:hypothetical protein
MRSPILKYIIVLVFVLVLIPSVIIPFVKNQKNIQSELSQYEEILSAIDEQSKPPEDNQLYDKYMQSVLGTYDKKEPKDEYIEKVLEDVDEIVDGLKLNDYISIEPNTDLPIVDLSISSSFTYTLGTEDIKVKYERPEEYNEPLQYIFMYTPLLYQNKKVCDVQIRETGDFEGNLSLHIFNNGKLQYPVMIVGTERIASYRDIYSSYYLIDSQLVKYTVLDEKREPRELRSTLDIDMYIKDNQEYILTYWEDPALVGTKKSFWLVDHENREVVFDYSVLDISN